MQNWQIRRATALLSCRFQDRQPDFGMSVRLGFLLNVYTDLYFGVAAAPRRELSGGESTTLLVKY